MKPDNNKHRNREFPVFVHHSRPQQIAPANSSPFDLFCLETDVNFGDKKSDFSTAMSPSPKKEGSPPPLNLIYSKTQNFPFQLRAKERRELLKENKAKKEAISVKYSPPPVRSSRVIVSVDSSKAKSNIDVLRLCMKDLGWREYPFGKREGWCDIYWIGGGFTEAPLNLVIGSVNKFPGMFDVLRKANLTRALDAMRQLFPNEYNFYPQTWYMPQQYPEFDAEFRLRVAAALSSDGSGSKTGHRSIFIAKPDEGSQGDGIYLFREPEEFIMKPKQQVVQEYLTNPLLLDGLKFDLRVYVVLSSVDPLNIYICREGLARFCTIAYHRPSSKNMTEMYMHLTNYSLNKHSSGYVHTDNQGDGSKRTLSSVLLELGRMGHDVLQVWWEIEKVVTKTIVAILPELRVEMNTEFSARRGMPRCCQILGFDILLLDNLKAYLLEVNASPSMRIDYEKDLGQGLSEYQPSPVDELIKQPLVRDTLLLMAPKRYTKRRESLRQSQSTNTRSNDVGTNHHSSLQSVRENLSDDNQKDEVTADTKADDDTSSLRPKTASDSDESRRRLRRRRRKHQLSNTSNTFGLGEDDESCLEEIYPSRYGDSFGHLRVLEKVSKIFQQCVGIRGSLRMGASGFRAFARRHCLIGTGFSSADIDLIFIEMVRKWEYLNPDRTYGLCFQGFVDAFFSVGKRKFPGIRDRFFLLQEMIEFCEKNNASAKDEKKGVEDRLPKILAEEERIENLKKIYGRNNLPINRRRRGISVPYMFRDVRDKS